MRRRKPLIAIAVLIFVVVSVAGCNWQKSETVDKTPLPAVAAPPYICDHIPLQAVELATGLHDPLVRDDLQLSDRDGSCAVYEPTGEKWKVMEVLLSSVTSVEDIDEEVAHGAKRLQQIVPGWDGYYFSKPYGNGSDHAGYTRAVATLMRGDTSLVVEIIRGPQGRDTAADAVALMRLIGPKLAAGVGTPSSSPTKEG
ncbi:hypothetical protein [Acrocarpospora catenulata]|uniref:hypothetical protein n=1 Tax=Acrocarpospora catenulata TaxID=2836182 RepID=UPI001BD91B9C|nr:hypothetical protein [Acrocarpospora catenulata]